MIIFGGTTDPSKNPYGETIMGSNDLWVWSTTLRQWSQPTIGSEGLLRPQKFFTSIPLLSQGKMLSVVGNASANYNNLLMLDTYNWIWSVPTSPNAAVAPPLRLGAAVGTSDALIFVHGGLVVSGNGLASSGNSGVLNDLTKLDDSTFQWTSIANGPSLMYHTMCRMPGLNMMAIFGGSDQNVAAYNVVNTFDLNLEVWRLRVPVGAGIGGAVPSARKGHTAVCLDDTMIVYGGGPDGPLDDDVWVLNASTTNWVWNRMTTNKQAGPGPRTGHSALLNGTNMLVWGGYGTPIAGDTNVYILDTQNWRWSSSKEFGPSMPEPVIPTPDDNNNNDPTGTTKKNNLPLTIGVVCGSLALIIAVVGLLLFRRRSTRRKKEEEEEVVGPGLPRDPRDPRDPRGPQMTSRYPDGGNGSYASGEKILESMERYESTIGHDSGSSSTNRRSQGPQAILPGYGQGQDEGYPMQTMAASTRADLDSNRATSSRSSGHYYPPPPTSSHARSSSQADADKGTSPGTVGARVGSISSDPFYPSYLAEDDEEDADRWTFASSLSFDQRENSQGMPTLRYIPARVHASGSAQRHSTGSIGANSNHRIPMMIHPANRSTRRDPSGMSVLSGTGSSLGPGSISLAVGTSSEVLNREGSSSSPRDATLFNSVSPLDRVTLMCSGLGDDKSGPASPAGLLSGSGSVPAQQAQQLTAQSYLSKESSSMIDQSAVDLRRKDTTSTSTTKSSKTYTTLDSPALASLVQNLPARYKLSNSPSPIHGETNDILFAIDSDTQQPIVIKSFARKEAWERECRTLKRLRGPCVVELKHVATLVLSETDDPNKPAKIRLTILERLDETLAQMLKNARKAKKVSLREQAGPDESLDLTGPALYKSGPALDEGFIRDIVKGVLRTLMWCHSRRIVYCDLKPSNVMHNRDDPRQRWKLIDLESSRVASEECIGIGTVRYCPPEVARGTTIDKQASSGVIANYSIDLWAFGCLVFELFATRALFPLSLSDDTVLHFLAHPSADTPALATGLRWNSSRELEIPHFEMAVPDPQARNLIRMLLKADPNRRATMTQVLNCEYMGKDHDLQESCGRRSMSTSHSTPSDIIPFSQAPPAVPTSTLQQQV
ncbi:F-box only protein 42 [Mortierella sp. AD031]|nr:F-box only protein 42 [Mortierella sp. AD031]KAG0205085.1 F-box only protein 42 [Mortierella sp. NVP41]